MADRSVLTGLRSSPKGQLSYEGKMKAENILHCLVHVSVQRVVEEHSPRRSEAEVASVAPDPGPLGLSGGKPKGRVREDPGTGLGCVPSTAVVEHGRRSSKEGEEAAHSCR